MSEVEASQIAIQGVHLQLDRAYKRPHQYRRLCQTHLVHFEARSSEECILTMIRCSARRTARTLYKLFVESVQDQELHHCIARAFVSVVSSTSIF